MPRKRPRLTLTAAALLAGFTPGAAWAAGVGCYADEVLADRPMAYWRFSERSGSTVADATDGGLTMNVRGGALLGQPGALDRDSDPAARMDGGFLDTTGMLSIGTAATVEAWYNCNGGTGLVVSISGGDVKTRALSCDNGQILGVGDHSASWPSFTVRANTTPSQAWHHAVFVAALDGGTTDLALYVDGVFVKRCTAGTCDGSPGAVAMSTYSATPFIGRSAAGHIDPGPVSVDEVAIYGSALTPARIAAHFAAGRRAPPLPEGSACCYPSDCVTDDCTAGTCGAASAVPPAAATSGCASWPASALPFLGALGWVVAMRRFSRRRVG